MMWHADLVQRLLRWLSLCLMDPSSSRLARRSACHITMTGSHTVAPSMCGQHMMAPLQHQKCPGFPSNPKRLLVLEVNLISRQCSMRSLAVLPYPRVSSLYECPPPRRCTLPTTANRTRSGSICTPAMTRLSVYSTAPAEPPTTSAYVPAAASRARSSSTAYAK